MQIEIVENFNSLPDNAGLAIPVWMLLSGRSRASTYRDIRSGRLESFKIGCSTRLRVGSCRRALEGGI